jgi:hypothetical protein
LNRVATEVTDQLVEEVDEFDGWRAPPPESPEPSRWSRLWASIRRTQPEPEPAPQSEEAAPYAAFVREIAPTRTTARSDSGRRLDAHLLTILATAGAFPALRLPEVWVAVCAIVAIALHAADSVSGQATEKGSADVVVLPARAVGGVFLGFINPLNWLAVLLAALASLGLGALAAGVIAAARWLALEGPDGVLAATRAGVWAHAPTYGAVFACFFLLRGAGHTRKCRAVMLYRFTRRLPEVALAGMVVVAVLAAALLAVAGPRVDVGFVHGSDALGWVPPGLRTLVDGLRDDAVDEELDALTRCLDGGQPRLWTYTYTAGNALDEPDVARLVADPGRAPDQRAIATAVLAAQNHLAPWVEVLEVAVGGDVVVAVDRRGLARDEPVTDASELRSHAFGAPEWLTAIAPTVDEDAVLTCSARTPF